MVQIQNLFIFILVNVGTCNFDVYFCVDCFYSTLKIKFIRLVDRINLF